MSPGTYRTEPTICQQSERTQLSVDALDTSHKCIGQTSRTRAHVTHQWLLTRDNVNQKTCIQGQTRTNWQQPERFTSRPFFLKFYSRRLRRYIAIARGPGWIGGDHRSSTITHHKQSCQPKARHFAPSHVIDGDGGVVITTSCNTLWSSKKKSLFVSIVAQAKYRSNSE